MIVVLVILAILAAILVPALLGWIDKAKEKQYVLQARSIYVATQAALDEEYAKKTPTDIPAAGNKISDTMKEEIVKMADVECGDITINSYAIRQNGGTQAEISGMTITSVGATSGGPTYQLINGEWKKTS